MIDNNSYNSIPDELRQRRQWVCYRMEKSEETGELTKIPRKPYGGARAKINDPEGWGTFEEALKASPRYDGIEFMLSSDDPYTFIDLDHCVDADGNIERNAQKIINDFDSYTEFSRSGTGIHILVQGKKPGTKCRTAKHPGIEIYDSVRPIVMTGKLVPNTPGVIQPAPNEIAALYLKIFGTDTPEEEPTRTQASTLDTNSAPQVLSDNELISKAIANTKSGSSFELLWNGNTSEYNGDNSAADQALCNHLAWWTNRDAERVDRLFRLSGLMRDKWERADYRNATIGKAISDCRGGFTGQSASAFKAKAKNKQSKQAISDNLENADDEFSAELKHLTDLGNAEYLIDLHGDKLRFNVNSGKWLNWDGTRWKPDDVGATEQLARQAVRSLYDMLKDIDDPDKSKALFAHIKKSESRPRLEAITSLAKYCPGIPVKASDMDANHWQVNCLNGTIDLVSGKLYPHAQSDHLSKIMNVEYNPDAKCPRWEQFLMEVFQDDKDLIEFIQRMVGYCLTGDTREESIFILYGKGQCGKSKFIEVLYDIFGDYVKSTPVTTFIERNDTSTADIAALVGARLVTASETSDNQSFNEPLLKQMTGRDKITCCFKFKDFFEYTPTFKIIFATNEIPSIRSQAYAMKRRLKIIPFKQRFYDPEDGKTPIKDDQVGAKLAAEMPGILAWAVQGCLKWQKDGLKVPAAIKREVNAIFDAQDPLAEFIDTQCDINIDSMIETNKLWRHYLAWCDNETIKPAFKQTTWFSKNLTKRDSINTIRGVRGARMLQGITLKRDALDTNRDTSQPSLHEGNTWGKISHDPYTRQTRHESNNIDDETEDNIF